MTPAAFRLDITRAMFGVRRQRRADFRASLATPVARRCRSCGSREEERAVQSLVRLPVRLRISVVDEQNITRLRPADRLRLDVDETLADARERRERQGDGGGCRRRPRRPLTGRPAGTRIRCGS